MTTPDGAASSTPKQGLDRRALLQRIAAASAIGVVAPLTIESLVSPAAACSGPQLVATVLVGNNAWQRSTNNSNVFPNYGGDPTSDGARRYQSPTFAYAARSLVVVTAAVYWSDTSNLLTPTLTGGGLTWTAPTVQRIDNNTEAARAYLMTWTGRNNTASPNASAQVVINLGAAEGDGFVGQIVQVVRTGAVIAPQAGTPQVTALPDQNLTTANQFVQITGLLSPLSAASGEMMFAAGLCDDDALDTGQINNLQAATWSSTAYGSPIAQNFVDGGTTGTPAYGTAYDITMGAFFRTTTVGSRTARLTAATSPGGQPTLDLDPAVPVDLGTVTLEVTCA